jgi:hypothetical protein
MADRDERRSESRVPTDETVVLVVSRVEAADQPPTRIEARLVDRSRSGCSVAIERLRVDSLHLLDCIEDPATFRIEVTLPSQRRPEPSRTATVVWINRVFEGAGPVFRLGLALGKPV